MDLARTLAGFDRTSSKDEVRSFLSSMLASHGLEALEINDAKPWGIEVKIAQSQINTFVQLFFSSVTLPADLTQAPYGPKFLFIAPEKRLSWHVHERKDAFLHVLLGPIHAYMNTDDAEVEPDLFQEGELVHIPELVRHRLGSPDVRWSLVAEISRNVFPDHPSDDEDERRISDDFGRA